MNIKRKYRIDKKENDDIIIKLYIHLKDYGNLVNLQNPNKFLLSRIDYISFIHHERSNRVPNKRRSEGRAASKHLCIQDYPYAEP